MQPSGRQSTSNPPAMSATKRSPIGGVGVGVGVGGGGGGGKGKEDDRAPRSLYIFTLDNVVRKW